MTIRSQLYGAPPEGYVPPTATFTPETAPKPPGTPEAEAIRRIGYDLVDWLVKKNHQYGSSAFDPVRIFSKADAVEQIKVRMDDKLSRLSRGNASMEADDDVIRDLAGYLIIYLAAKELQEKGSE